MKALVRILLVVILGRVGVLAQNPAAVTAATINQRGMGSRSSPTITTGGVATVLGSQSYTYSVPLFSLSGRHGLNLNLALVYNNLIWQTAPGGSIMYNPDASSPFPGFRLDFGSLIWNTDFSGGISGVLIDASGAK